MTEIDAESFAFMVDVATRDEPMIGLQIATATGDEYIVPMSLETAQNVGSVLLGHVAALHAASKATYA
jgi:hypothetical protein